MSESVIADEAVGMSNREHALTVRENLVRSFFLGTGRSYDRVVRMFTLGLDDYWKTEIVKLVPESERILDLGCGTGILTEYLALKNPGTEIVGVDVTPDYLMEYDGRIRENPWIRAHSILANAETVALEGDFDAVVSSYLAKYVDPKILINNISPHLKRGGAFIAHDFIMPANPLYLASWRAYTGAMSHIGSALFPEWRTALGNGFGLIRSNSWLDAFMVTLREFNYHPIQCRRLSFETAGLVWATKG